MKTKITFFLLTFFMFVSNINSQTDPDPDRLGGPVFIGNVAPFTLPVDINSQQKTSAKSTKKGLINSKLSVDPSLEWPNPGAVHIEKTAESTPTLGKWKINILAQGKNIQSTTDVVLVIDNSGSMSGTKITNAKAAANNFINTVLGGSTGIRIAVVTINAPGNAGTPNVNQGFTNNIATLNTAVNAISASGGTNIQGGFYAARLLTNASTATKKVVILLSDGAPTYSYSSTVTTDFAVDCGSISNFNISRDNFEASHINVTSSNYSTIVGSGGSFDYTLYTFSKNCAGGSALETFTAGNHGIPTKYEAKLLMNSGVDVYTIGFEVPAAGDEQDVLNGSQNKGYYPATSSNISDIYAQIGANIAYAATNAVFTDPMSTYVVLESAAIPTYSVSPTTTGNVVVSKGTVTFVNNGFVLNDPDIPSSGNSSIIKWKVIWNIGTISETGDHMYYYVNMAPNTSPSILYDANDQTFINYTDVNGNTSAHQETPTDFTIPKVSGGKGSIEIKYYTVNESGQPINSIGTVVTKETAVQLIPGSSKYFEFNGSTALDVNQAYTVIPEDPYFSSVTNTLHQLYCTFGNMTVTPTPSVPNVVVWFGYRISAAPTVTLIQPICTVATGTITVTSPAATAGISYTVTGTNPILAPVTNTTGIFAGLAAGVYSVTYKLSVGGCASTPTSVTINTKPITPAAPTLPIDVTVCETGSQQTLTATATVPAGTTIVWYDAAAAGNIVNPPTLVSTVAATRTLYAEAQTTANGCLSLTRTAVVLKINPAPAAPTLPVNVTVCETGSQQTLTATATVPAGTTIVWYDAAAAGNIVNPPTLVSTVAATRTLYAEAQTTANGCMSLTRTAVVLKINPAPAAPTLPVNVTVCETGSQQTLTATATVPAGTTIVWYDAAAAGNIVNPPTLVSTVAATRTLYAEAQTTANGCMSLTRTAVVLKINPAPAAPTLPVNVTVCETGSQQTLTATATVPAGTTIVWYDAAAAGNIVNPPTLVSTVAATRTLYAEAQTTANGCMSLTRTAVVLKINPAPAAPTLPVNVTVCETGSQQTLTATATVPAGTTIVWYDAAAAGNIVNPPTLVSTVAATRTLYAEAQTTANGCMSLTRTAVVLKINPAPAAPTLPVNVTVCETGSQQTLTATATVPAGTTIVWYDAAAAGNIVNPPTLVSTVAATRTLYAEAQTTANGCMSLTRTAVVLKINPAPAVPTLPVNVTVCETGSQQTLTATATVPAGTTIVWYDAAAAGNIVNPPTLVSTVAATRTLYAEAQTTANGCMSLTRTAVVLKINPAPAVPTLPVNVTVCETGSQQTLNATATVPAGTTIVWYDAATAGNIVNPPTLVSTVAATRTLYAEAQTTANGCMSLTRTAVVLKINPAPAVPTLPVNVTVCETGSQQTLTATATVPAGTTIVWYDAAAAGNIVNPPTLVSTVAATRTLYAEAQTTANGCMSLTRTAVVLKINPAPAVPTLPVNVTVCETGSQQTLNATATVPAGTTIVWYDAATAGNIVNPPTLVSTVAATRTLYAEAQTTANGCMSLTRTAVVLTINNGPTPPTSGGDQTVCEASPIQPLTATATGGTITWYDAPTAGNVVINPTLNSVGTITYYAQGSDNGNCSSLTRTAVKLTINPALVAEITSKVDVVCIGKATGSATSSATGGTGEYSYSWNTSPPQLTATATGLIAGDYIVTVTDAKGCSDTESVTILDGDGTPPTFTRPADITIYTSTTCSYDASIAVTGDVTDEADNVSTQLQATYSDSDVAGACEGSRIITRTWSLVDNCGNKAEDQVQTITVNDNLAPTWTTETASLNATIECSNLEALATAQAQFPVATDNCDTDVTNISKTSGQFVANESCANSGTYTNTWTVTDACGNPSAEFVQVITIEDKTAPTWSTETASLNATVECSNLEALATAQAQFPVATDNCDTDVTNISKTSGQFVANEVCANSGTYTNTWTVTDACGNLSTEFVQVITIEDKTAPTWSTETASLNATVECSNLEALATAQAQFPVATDNCDTDVTNISKTSGQFVANESCANSGTYTNTWTVTDACGNPSAEFVQVITIEDKTAPTWSTETASLNATVECSNLEALATAQAQFPVATDNCDTDVTNISKTSGQFVANEVCANSGTYTNTWTVTDACGNLSTEFVQVITIEDKTAPTWTTETASLNATVECSNLEALATAQAQFPVATDNCDTDVTNISKTSGQFVANEGCANSGTYTNTWTVTDACGNLSAEFVQIITIEDKTAPTWTTETASLNATVECSNLEALATAQAQFPVATDNCDTDVTNISKTSGQFVANEGCANSGTYTNTWTVTDACGNLSAEFVQVITVEDTTPPVIVSCSSNQTIATDSNCQAIVPDFTSIAVTDNCSSGESITVTQSPVAGTVVQSGTTSIIVTATDACGNKTSCETQLIITNFIVANDDSGAPINGYIGGTVYTNVLSNDLLNCVAATTENVTISFVSSTNTGITLSGTDVVVAPGTPAGPYSLVYQICEIANPENCDTATVSFNVTTPIIDAVDDNAGPIDGLNGATNVVNVFNNDTLNGAPVIPADVTLTLVTADPTGYMTMNPDGSIDLKDGTPAGTYQLTYQICENLNIGNCDTAVVTVDVICNNTTKISGVVYHAGNNNSPLANVPITLTPINILENGQNVIIGPPTMRITNAEGYYNFTGMPPGDYVLQVQDANLNAVQELYNTTSSFLILKVEICNYLVRNFGYDKTDDLVLGNFVWYDLNKNGLQDEWYDANNDNDVTQNIPDANGAIDYSQWEWIDFNGDGKYTGPENEGELNAAGFGNGTTNIPNLFVTGPNAFSVSNTMGILGNWRVRPPKENWGEYSVELKMESNLDASAQAIANTGLVKNFSGSGTNTKIKAKTAKMAKSNAQIHTICGVTNGNPQSTELTPEHRVDLDLDFGIICKEFGAEDVEVNANCASSGIIGNILERLIALKLLSDENHVTTDLLNFYVDQGDNNPNIKFDTLGNINLTGGIAAGTYTFNYNLADKLDPTNFVSAKIILKIEDLLGPIVDPSITNPFSEGNISQLKVNCDAVPPAPELRFIDSCSSVGNVDFKETKSNESSDNYTITREWVVTDGPGNKSTFTQIINVHIQNGGDASVKATACNADSTPIDLSSLLIKGSPLNGTWFSTDKTVDLKGSNMFNALDVPVGNYIFEYKIPDGDPCATSIQVNMTVNDDCKVLGCEDILVHNTFSPNWDGVNDKLVIDGVEDNLCYPSGVAVEIYNRWGILVFETSKYNNETNAFDGYSRGRTTVKESAGLPAGTYYFILNYDSLDGNGVIQNNKKDGFIYLSR